jgi:uroporphyrinogen-III decarboxylase
MIMHKGEAALRAEFERLMPSVKNGRFILGVDHQTPPGVSYDDYKLFVKLFKEYAVK